MTMTPQSVERGTDSPKISAASEGEPKSINGEGLRQLVLENQVLVAAILANETRLGGVKTANGEKEGVMDWKRLLETALSPDECAHWARCVAYWRRPPITAWQTDLRSMLNTYTEDIDRLGITVKKILEIANQVWEGYLHEIFHDHPDMREKYAVSHEIEKCRNLLTLIGYAVSGRPDGKKGIPRRNYVKRRKLAWEARRKIALSLLVRSIQQDTGYAYRMENSTHFEDEVLRNRGRQKHALISPQVEYEPARVCFTTGKSTMNIISRGNPDRLESLSEHVDLYRIEITGRPAPYEKPVTLSVFALPGNKSDIDVRDHSTDLPEVRAMELRTRQTIMSYKSLYAMALKRLRGKEIRDMIRCTFIVDTPEEEVILKKILETELGSTVNREDFGQGGNAASARDYRATHIIESIHNERAGRNYAIEIRIFQLQDFLRDRSQIDEVGHHAYRRRRSVRIYPTMLPHEQYPDVERDIMQTGAA